MFQIKPTTLSPVYKFDKSFTEKWYNKIVWLLLVVVVTFFIFYAVSICLFPNPEDFEAANGDHAQGRLMLLFRLLYDPSTVDLLTSGARAFGVVVVIVGMIIFMGMLISVASNILNSHIDRYEKGEFDYTFDYHYIILGFNHTTPALIKKIRAEKKNSGHAILILSDMPSNEIRTILNNEVPKKQLEKIIIKNGQRTSEETLNSLKIDKALQVWIIGEVDEFGHDPLNIKCLNSVVDICKNSPSYLADRVDEYEKRLAVFVQFEEQSTLSAFQTEDITSNWKNEKGEKLIRFRASNYDDDWARKLIVTNQYDGEKNNGKYPTMDDPSGKDPITYDSDKRVHLVIFGMTQMGLAVAKRAAHNIHLPNFVRDSNLKTTITFIDKDCKSGMEMFRNRYAQIFEIQSSEFKDFTKDEIIEKHFAPTKFIDEHADFLDINYQFIQAEPESERVHNYLSSLADEEQTMLSIAVCYDDPNTNLNIGLNLPRNLYYPIEAGKVIPVFIRQFTCGSLLDIFKMENGRYRNVYPFGMWDGCEFDDEKDRLLAKMVNHTYNMKDQLDNQTEEIKTGNRKEYSLPFNADESKIKYLRELVEPKNEESAKLEYYKLAELYNNNYSIIIYTDEYAKKWKHTTVTDQWSSQFSADSIAIKKRCVRGEIREENIENLAMVEHNRWNMAQLLMGFYFEETITNKEGEKVEKDKIKLLHSSIKPFGKLTEGTRDYDRFIVRMIPEMEKILKSKK